MDDRNTVKSGVKHHSINQSIDGVFISKCLEKKILGEKENICSLHSVSYRIAGQKHEYLVTQRKKKDN